MILRRCARLLHYKGNAVPHRLSPRTSRTWRAGTPLGGSLLAGVPSVPAAPIGSDKEPARARPRRPPRRTQARPPPPHPRRRGASHASQARGTPGRGGRSGEGGSLGRSLGLWQLTMISIGATLGTGIVVVLGDAVPEAGPAVTPAFVIAGPTALFSALSYAEPAGTVPVAGSSYSYAYPTMGELVAWVCGWCLVLEHGVSVAAVAVGRGEYLDELLNGTIGVTVPAVLSSAPGEGGIIDLPALIVVLPATRVGTHLQGAVRAGAAGAGLPVLRVQHVRPRYRHLGRLRVLDGRRSRVLLPVRLSPFPSRDAGSRGGRSSRDIRSEVNHPQC